MLASTQSQSHYYECEYFYVDLIDPSKANDIKITRDRDISNGGYLTWIFSWLPSTPNSGGGATISISDVKWNSTDMYVGQTSSGKYVYKDEAGAGFFNGEVASITLK